MRVTINRPTSGEQRRATLALSTVYRPLVGTFSRVGIIPQLLGLDKVNRIAYLRRRDRVLSTLNTFDKPSLPDVDSGASLCHSYGMDSTTRRASFTLPYDHSVATGHRWDGPVREGEAVDSCPRYFEGAPKGGAYRWVALGTQAMQGTDFRPRPVRLDVRLHLRRGLESPSIQCRGAYSLCSPFTPLALNQRSAITES